ncbi:MAG: hypothetical protein AAF846_12750 [Chloroflexota bacterium]
MTDEDDSIDDQIIVTEYEKKLLVEASQLIREDIVNPNPNNQSRVDEIWDELTTYWASVSHDDKIGKSTQAEHDVPDKQEGNDR